MKLSLYLSVFFISILCSVSRAQKSPAKNFFVPQISVKVTFTGDIRAAYQFSGALGDRLKGEPEKPDSVCENTSQFQQVLHRQQKSLQVWMTLKCTTDGQSFEYKPQRLFVDLKKPDQIFNLPVLSEKYRHISIQMSELQIKDTPPKK